MASEHPVAADARIEMRPQSGSVARGKDAQIRELALALLRQTDDVQNVAPALWEVAEQYRDEQVAGRAWKESTRENNEYLLREVLAELGHLPIDEITPTHARALLVRWADRPAAAKHRLELLARLRAFAEREGYPVGPELLGGLRLPTINPRTRYLEIGEVVALGGALDDLERRELIERSTSRCIRGLLLTGLRLSEFAGLCWSEVDLPGSVLRLRTSKVGARVVPIGADVVRWLSCMHRESECVCPTRGGWKGKPVSSSGVRNALKRATTAAGLDGVSPHTLRHTWATTAYLGGTPVSTIQIVLGHSSPQQTVTYLHTSIRQAIPDATRVASQLSIALAGGAR